MMSPDQCRMARAAIGLSASELAAKAGVGGATVARFERGESRPIGSTLRAMQAVLEQAGIVFLAAGETTAGGPGVRFRGGTE